VEVVIPKIKRLVFGKGLMSPSLDGEKTFTIRKYKEGTHDFKKGEIIKGVFRDGLDILLQITDDPKIDKFNNLKRAQLYLALNRYYFDTKYFRDLKKWYPELTWDDVGIVIFFEVLKVEGVSVVSLNEHMK
jgi:hypothetical protein